MAETMQGISEGESTGSSSRTWLIVVVIVVVLCCLFIVCGGAVYWLWTTGGDLILEQFEDWSALLSFVS